MVRVNIYRGAFGGAFDSVEVKVGVPLCESLPAIDWERTIAHNGTIAVNGAYIPSEGETIAMRVYPAGHIVIGALIAVAVYAVADAITWGITGEHIIYWAKKGLQKLLLPDEEQTSNKDDKEEDLPTLRGAKNKSQDGHPFPFVLGHTRLTPYYVGAPYMWQDGNDGETQHYCALYNLGYGKMAVGAIKFGEIDAAHNGMVESYVNGGYKLQITEKNKTGGALVTGADSNPPPEHIVLSVRALQRSQTRVSQNYLRDSYGRIRYDSYGRPRTSSYSTTTTYYWWWLNWVLTRALTFNLTVTCNGETVTIPKGMTSINTSEHSGRAPSVDTPVLGSGAGNVDVIKSGTGRVEFVLEADKKLPDEGGNAKFKDVEFELLEPGEESTFYSQKVVSEELSFELLHPAGSAGLVAERFTATNPQKVQVEIGFNGLFHMNDDGDIESKSASVCLEYSTDGGMVYRPFGGFAGGSYDGAGTTTFSRATRKKMYFTAERTFTYDEAINCTNKVVQLRIWRVDTQSTSTRDGDTPCCTAIRTWCFDRDKSLETKGPSKTLVPQRPMDESKMRLTTRLALRMVATDDLQGTLDELNMICVAKCRTWNGEAWSAADDLSPSSNPASNVLRLMQSPMLGKKAYNDGMIDMEAFGELYDYCDKMTCNTESGVIPCPFEVNGALLNKKKLSETVDTMLSTCRAYRTLNGFKYSVFIDKPMNVPTLLLNNHNFLTEGLTNKKEFRDVVDGFRVKFVNENNGFETDELVVMLNGEKSPAPDSIMESIELPWQTNPRQVYMNALFEGGKRKLRPETWTRKVAQEGNLIEIGSLLEIQDDTILVGIGDGAIIKSCLVDYGLGLVKGITVNNPINIDGTAGKYGVRIMRALDGEKPFVGTYEIVIPAEGVFTDTFVFATGAPTDDPRSPMPGDFCSFGELNRETIGAICIGRKENGDGTFDLTLVPYSEALYHLTDGNIPEFDSKLSGIQHEVVEKLPDEYATKGDVAVLEAMIGGSGIYAPPAPQVTLAEAREEGIAVAHGPLAGGDAAAAEEWQIDKGDGEGEHDWKLEAGILHFDRKVDGYMEADVLYDWKVRCRVQGARSLLWSEWSAWRNVDADNYGTYIPEPPRLRIKIDNRAVLMAIEQPFRADGRKLYGDVTNSVLVRREDPVRDPIYALDSNGERIKEGTGYKMTDSDYKGMGERQYFKPVTGASYSDGEGNYKDGEGDHAVKDKRVDCYDEYKQIMPLRGQGEAGFERREEWQNKGADTPTSSLSYIRKSESSLLGGETPDVPHDVQDRNFTGNYPVSIFTRGADKSGNTFDADYGKLCMDLYGDSGYKAKFTPLLLQVRDKNGELGYIGIEKNIAAVMFERERV